VNNYTIALAELMNQEGKLLPGYLKQFSPGLLPSDPLPFMSMLMSSKRPDALIKSLVYSGKFNLCQNKLPSNLTNLEPSCDPGFVLDGTTGLCYKVLNNQSNFWEAKSKACSEIAGANLLEFEQDSQVKGFLNLVQSGKTF